MDTCLTVDTRRPKRRAVFMAHQLTTPYIKDSTELFRHYKKLAERALAQCLDEGLFTELDTESNCIAIIVKHMAEQHAPRAGKISRPPTAKSPTAIATQTEAPPKSRAELMELWESGWKYLFDALETPCRRGCDAHRLHPHRAAFRHAGHQSPDRPLFLSCRPDHLSRQTFRRPIRPMDCRHSPPQKVRRLQRQSRLWPGLAALVFKSLLPPWEHRCPRQILMLMFCSEDAMKSVPGWRSRV